MKIHKLINTINSLIFRALSQNLHVLIHTWDPLITGPILLRPGLGLPMKSIKLKFSAMKILL